jgi:rsbT co-antagonist protein RsbR
VIVTGISAAIALTIVTIGVDLSRIQTVGDLQGGIDLADRLLGYGAIARVSDPGPIVLSNAV